MARKLSARAIAALVLAQVVGRGRSLDVALVTEVPGDCDRQARAFTQALCYGALRNFHRHEFLLQQMLRKKPDDRVLALLHLGLQQVSDPRTPDHAAVGATVDAARELGRASAAGLINAVLRRFLRERCQLESACAAQPVCATSHPPWLLRRLAQDWPVDIDSIVAANNAHPPQWLRVNIARTDRQTYVAALAAAGLEGLAAEGSTTAVRLTKPAPVADLPGFDEGWVSVQDAAAQHAAPLLDAQPGMRVLDACAAPGGKTCHLLERAGGELDLTAVDTDASRISRIEENFARLRLSAKLVHGDAGDPTSWWDGQLFDRILLDAPCSGSGVIRRHPDIKLLRRETDLEGFTRTQSRLLAAGWRMLAPGGRLLYATCSVLKQENAALVAGFLARNPDASSRETPIAARDSGPGKQILPGEADMDGFYYACLGKAIRGGLNQA